MNTQTKEVQRHLDEIAGQLWGIIQRERLMLSEEMINTKECLGYFHSYLLSSISDLEQELENRGSEMAASRLILEGQLIALQACLENFNDYFGQVFEDELKTENFDE